MVVPLLLAAIALTVVCLVIRNQTEYRLSQLRTALLTLRSEEKRLAQEHTDLEQMIAQVGEAVARGERRRQRLREDDLELTTLLIGLHREVRGVELDASALRLAEPGESGG